LRQIGTLPKQLDPTPFTNHLTALGYSTRVDERPEGWLIWIYDEDHLPQARQELVQYVEKPEDPRFHGAKEAAAAVQREQQRKKQEYRNNVRDLRRQWDRPNLQRKPLTVALMVASIAVFFLLRSPTERERVEETLLFSRLLLRFPAVLQIQPSLVLDDITQRGEIWRLVTPIFLHFNGMHILFNMMALWALGSLIETRWGTLTLAILVGLSAIASNVGQIAYDLSISRVVPFGGMSGVVYALFGYLWMKGKVQPEQGVILHPSSVQMMLFWLVLCMTGVLGPIANAAHVVGLVVGVMFGLARF